MLHQMKCAYVREVCTRPNWEKLFFPLKLPTQHTLCMYIVLYYIEFSLIHQYSCGNCSRVLTLTDYPYHYYVRTYLHMYVHK